MLKSILTNRVYRNIFIQAFVVLMILIIVYGALSNLLYHYSVQHKTFDFSFLWNRSGYPAYSPVLNYTEDDSNFTVYAVGLINTLIVSFFGIILATILGLCLALFRLSNNWLADKVSYLFTELFRNTPLLLQVYFLYFFILNVLPPIRNAVGFKDFLYFSNRGLLMPRIHFEQGLIFFLLGLILSFIAVYFYGKYAKKKHDTTGKPQPKKLISLCIIIVVTILVFLIFGGRTTLTTPHLTRFNFKGGMAIRPEMLSLIVSLALCTGAYIGEIFRAGIISVDKGQHEAAISLGLSYKVIMFKIIIPQALKVSIPSLNSQYLNLMKNSSLAIVIGFADINSTIGNQTLTQTGREIECMVILTITYLVISLIMSSAMNIWNKYLN